MMEDNKISFDELEEMVGFSLNDKVDTQTVNDLVIDIPEPTVEEEVETPLQQELQTPTETEERVDSKLDVEISNNTPNIYATLIKDRLETKEWEDLLVGEEGEEKPLSDILDTIDEETYKAVLQRQQEIKKEDIEKNYIKVENISEIKKSLINIVKNGDLDKVKELFKNPDNLREPFEDYDPDDEKYNENILKWYYSTQGHNERQIESMIKVDKEDEAVFDKAKQIVDWHKSNYANRIKNIDSQLEEERKKEEENLKTYRKTLLSEFKYLDENVAKKFTDSATKKNKNGDYDIDLIFEEKMKDPKTATRLIHFLLDEESFIKNASSSKEKQVYANMLKKLNIIRDTSKVSNKKEEKVEEENPLLDNIILK